MPARFVLNVFKVIAISMILFFVADIAIYLFKAFQTQQRLDSLAVSMQRVVMQNNYLPDSEFRTYSAIFDQLGTMMNGKNVEHPEEDAYGRDRVAAQNGNDSFMVRSPDANSTTPVYVHMNYNAGNRNQSCQANGTLVGVNSGDSIVINTNGSNDPIFEPGKAEYDNLACPAEYGDIKYIQLSVELVQPIWGFSSSSRANTNGYASGQAGHKAANWTSNADGVTFGHPTTHMYFSYMVPCLHYNAIT